MKYSLAYDIFWDYEGVDEDRASGIMYLNVIVTYRVPDTDRETATQILGDEIPIQLDRIMYKDPVDSTQVQCYYCDREVSFPFLDTEYTAE